MSIVMHFFENAFQMLRQKNQLQNGLALKYLDARNLKKKLKQSLSGDLKSVVFIEKLLLPIAKNTKFLADQMMIKL